MIAGLFQTPAGHAAGAHVCTKVLVESRQGGNMLFMPLVQVLLFGYAIRTEVDDIRLVVVDPSPDAAGWASPSGQRIT